MKNPFPGLRPFQPGESHLFFGRQKHVDEIMQILERGRFVSVVGNSGSGKSSLIRAGVLPQLAKDGNWEICTMRPGASPIDSLGSALFESKLCSDTFTESEVQNTLKQSNLGLLQLIRAGLTSEKKLLLLVDQFEEVFRFQGAEQKHYNESELFADMIVQSIGQNDIPVYIMLSLRSDFLGDCEQFNGLPEAINKGLFLIPRLNPEELKIVISGPVEYAKARISPILVQKLVNEIGNNPDQLPVLQHAMMRTWDVWTQKHSDEKPIDLDSYEATGGLNLALSKHAEEAFDEVTNEAQRKLTEAIFKIITFKGSDNRGVRRPTTVGNIAKITGASIDEIKTILNIFRGESRGFIMPPMNVALTEKTVIDISHESLMRVWDRLSQWSDEEAESAELYQLLTNSALLYEKDKTGLWHDPDLQLALDWREKNRPNEEWAKQYNAHFHKAIRFLEASLKHRNHLKVIAARNRKLAFSALILVIASLSVLSLWAFSERQNATKNAKTAIEERKSAQQQKAIAEKQKNLAELSLVKANAEEKKALLQKAEAEKQKNIALLRAEETRLQKLKAERATIDATNAQRAAEIDRQIAQSQKRISDTLRIKALESEKNANRLRILSVAQNLAISSRLRSAAGGTDDIPLLMSVQAYLFHKKNGGDPTDPVIYDALYSSIMAMPQYTENNVLRVHDDVVKSVAYKRDNSQFASAGDDGKIVFYNVSDPRKNQATGKMGFILKNLCYSPEGDRIACSGDNNKIILQNTSNPAESPVILDVVHDEKISAVLWTKAGIYTVAMDNKIRLIDPGNKAMVRSSNLPGKALCADYCEQTNSICVGLDNGSIYILSADLSNEPKLIRKTSDAQISSIAFNKNGDKLAYGSSDGSCGVLTLRTEVPRFFQFNGHVASVTGVRFSPGGEQLATSSLDGKIILWNALKPENSPQIITSHEGWVQQIAYSTNGSQLLSCGKDKTVRIHPTTSTVLYNEIKGRVSRDFTQTEWVKYIGADIPFESTKNP